MNDLSKFGAVMLVFAFAGFAWSFRSEAMPSESRATVEYEAQGIISYKGFALDGTLTTQLDRRFIVTVKDDRWHIRTVAMDIAQSLDDYCELAKDGPEIYSLLVFSTNALQTPDYATNTQTGRVTARRMRNTNIAAGSIRSSLVPTPDGHSLAPELWLALASAPYFRTVSNSFLRVPWLVWVGPGKPLDREALVPAKWNFLNERWKLPAHIDYFWPQSSASPAPVNTLALENEATNATYEVMSYTNAAGVTLPLTFRLLQFGKASHRILERVEGAITGISPRVQLASFIPVLPGKTTVDDYRTQRSSTMILAPPEGMLVVDVVKYVTTDKTWLPLEEVERRRAQGLLSPADTKRQTLAGRRLIFYLLAACLLITPLLFALVNRVSKQHKQ